MCSAFQLCRVIFAQFFRLLFFSLTHATLFVHYLVRSRAINKTRIVSRIIADVVLLVTIFAPWNARVSVAVKRSVHE